METKINIAEILKDKPKGTKLYSRICGAVELKKVINVRKKKSIVVKELNSNNQHRFWYDGNFFRAGQCVLQPSENMADWSKFLWKKGDVLVSNDGKCKVIFERFDDDTYTSFVGKYYVECYGKNYELQDYEEEHYGDTVNYTKESEEAAQTYIKTIEKRLGGNLNHETLEIENAQPEFKDGDIVVAEEDNYYDRVIFIAAIKDVIVSKALINVRYEDYEVNYNEYRFGHNRNLRLATDSEKQQLFSALEKEGKRWDIDKKAIVYLKQKCEFKPFDRCIWKIRNCEGSIWQASFVSYVDEYGASPMGMSIDEDLVNLIILPYNDKTKLLVGTTDDWKGGEQ